MIGQMVGSFFYLSFMSILVGAFVGLTSAFILKHFNMGTDPVKETMAMLAFAYLSYLLSDQCQFSPIISMFSCGLFMSHYTYLNVSHKT